MNIRKKLALWSKALQVSKFLEECDGDIDSKNVGDAIIVPSTSPFLAPVVLVKKKDNTWRMCVDYRAINDKIIKDKFQILLIEELLDEFEWGSTFHQARS